MPGGQKSGQKGTRILFLLQWLKHEKLLKDLGLTGLPDLSCQEHLVHYCVHLREKRHTAEKVRKKT